MPEHNPTTPHQQAIADRMHARGRDLFSQIGGEYRRHVDACTDVPACSDPGHETVAVADLGVEMYELLFACGHAECVEENTKQLCLALAYSVVRAAHDRPLTIERAR